ncbi:hypothetical protein B4U79_07381 [Dinothrombium tinctorium]|uniref:Uncharacterized protein n=1 Tax=Dinothrombium tinctorium TaxID=1965070 RepID=A0A443QBG0_9ACAR|nr:hypothetical protein B4U79_07381 [Dinothrombium tinctorium]
MSTSSKRNSSTGRVPVARK